MCIYFMYFLKKFQKARQSIEWWECAFCLFYGWLASSIEVQTI